MQSIHNFFFFFYYHDYVMTFTHNTLIQSDLPALFFYMLFFYGHSWTLY